MTDDPGVNVQQIVRGNHNVLIAGVTGGSQIEINFAGGTRLVPLEPAVVAVNPRVTAPGRLLKARAGVIPYTAHQGLLEYLVGWCHSGGAFAACVVGGGAGAGKTRLGVEACSRLSADDWLTGMLASIADRQELEALVTVETCRLIVIDYAETRTETMTSLLPLLATHASEQQRVRVLLLVRAVPRKSRDWTESLRDRGDLLDALADGMDVKVLAEEPFGLVERRSLFDAATAALLPRVGGTMSDPPQDLDSDLFLTPLTVVSAAYLALVEPDRRPSTRAELFDALLKHEDRYWAATGPGAPEDPQLRRRVVALATLTGAGGG